MTRLIIVRHGQSEANAGAIFAGHSDFDLTDFGREQAKLLADYLTKTEKIDKIYASDLKRAYNTALSTSQLTGVPIIADKTLREIYGGLWEAKTVDYIINTYPDDFNCWKDNFSMVRCTGGESIREVYQRIVPRICEISRENDGKTVLIATHATVTRSFNAYAMGLAYNEVAGSPEVVNAAICIYDMEGDRVINSRYNITDHLGDMVSKFRTKFNA